MISGNELKQVVMLTYLTDAMLEKLAQIIDVLRFEKGETIFREKDPAHRFYMLKSGYVLLEQRISDQVTACVAAIKPGYSFGWSSMIRNQDYTVNAICQEPSEVYSFRPEKLRALFQQDPEMGLRMYERILIIIKKRLDIRTEQFRKAIKNHPDMHSLFT